MPKGSGNRIIPNLSGSGLWRQYPGWKGATISLNMTQENPNTVEPLGVLEAPGARTTHNGTLTVSKKTLLVDTGLFKAHTLIQVTLRF